MRLIVSDMWKGAYSYNQADIYNKDPKPTTSRTVSG